MKPADRTAVIAKPNQERTAEQAIIRTMTIQDYEKVYDLWTHTAGMGLNLTDDSKEGIAKYLRRNPNTCFVAEYSTELVGAIMSGHDGRRGFIYHTAVNAEYRNKTSTPLKKLAPT